jgi:hypothetical protein
MNFHLRFFAIVFCIVSLTSCGGGGSSQTPAVISTEQAVDALTVAKKSESDLYYALSSTSFEFDESVGSVGLLFWLYVK